MSVLWTDAGALAVLERCFRSPPSVTLLTAFAAPMDAAPVMDRTRTAFGDWPTNGSVLDPGFFELTFATPFVKSIVGGRAVGTFGPPAFNFTVLTAFVCYGWVFANPFFDVMWVDRFDTPRSLSVGDSFQYLPWVTMTSECPPLGGCS